MPQPTGAPSTSRKRILFMAEAVTLAHVARPHVLAKGIQNEFDVLFACDPRYDHLFGDATYRRRPLTTISTERFLKRIESGSPIYDLETLHAYVKSDLEIIDDFRPHAIVGDFRLSLSVSARLRQIPYIAISNAYWSPEAVVQCPVPELPITRQFGYRIGGLLFQLGKTIGFALHARAHNQLRRNYGLRPFRADMRHIYVDGDEVLFADLEGLVHLNDVASNVHFVGPIPWAPVAEKPNWWAKAKNFPKPIIYVTLGSSGDIRALPTLIKGLSGLGGTVLLATAGRFELESDYDNVRAARFLPGDEVAAIADLVVCNGGSPTTYQALTAGKPVLGIPTNLDQCLNIATMKASKIANILRMNSLTSNEIQRVCRDLIANANSNILTQISDDIKRTSPVRSLALLLSTRSTNP